MKNFTRILGLTVLTLLFIVGSASAFLTPINPSGGGNGSEASLTAPGGILDTLYGLSNLTRVDDSSDQIWQACANCGTATYQAKYAGYNQYFGFSAINGTGKTPIFNSITGALHSTYQFTPGAQFLFYDDPNNLSAPVWYSLMSLNGGEDHMVTWKINSSNCDYVIAFEDLPFGTSDKDYNDLVIEVKNVTPTPIPAAVWLLGTGLVGLVGIRRRFKK